MKNNLEHKEGSSKLSPASTLLLRSALLIVLSQTACNEQASYVEDQELPAGTLDMEKEAEKSTTPQEESSKKEAVLPKPTIYGAYPSQLNSKNSEDLHSKLRNAQKSISLYKSHDESVKTVRIVRDMMDCPGLISRAKRDINGDGTVDNKEYKQMIDDFMKEAKEYCGEFMPSNIMIDNGFGGTYWNVICEESGKKTRKCPDPSTKPAKRYNRKRGI